MRFVADRMRRGLLPAVVVFSPAIPLQAYFAGNWGSILHSYSLGMFFGLISYTFFTHSLILAARIRAFDRLYGHDRVLSFHGKLAAGALVCAGVHAALKFIYYGTGTTQVTLGILALALAASAGVVTVLFMVDTALQRLKPFAALKRFGVSKLGLDYSRLKLYHNVNAVAVLLGTLHVLMAAPTAESWARMTLVASWGGVSLLVYVCHKFVRPALRYKNALPIDEVKALSEDIVRIGAAQRKGHALTWQAGQFGYFRIVSRACGIEEHPFTIASAPGADRLEIVVKALGNYTQSLKAVEIGARLMCDGPYGVFTPARDTAQYLFVAGGIGITPFLAILRAWEAQGITKPTTLVWSVRRKEDFVDDGLFARLAARCSAFCYLPVTTGSPEGRGRRIDLQMLQECLPSDAAKRTEAFICGPTSLRVSVARSLLKLGLPRRAIHYEAFSW